MIFFVVETKIIIIKDFLQISCVLIFFTLGRNKFYFLLVNLNLNLTNEIIQQIIIFMNCIRVDLRLFSLFYLKYYYF